MTLLPGSNVNVKVSVPMSSIPKVYAVQFPKPFIMPDYFYQMQLSVKVEGNGSARVFPENTNFFTSSTMSVSSSKKKPPSIIAEIYC